MRSSNALVLVVAAFVTSIAGGCEQLAPKPPKPKPPQPGAYLSIPFPDVRSLNDVVMLAPDLAYVVGTDGTILKYTSTPAKKVGDPPVVAWAKETSGTTEDLEAITGFLEDDGTGTGKQKEVMLVVGHNGVVLERAGAGKWAVVASNVTVDLFGVDLLSDTDGYVVGDAGTVLRYSAVAGAAHSLTLQTAQTQQDVAGLQCPVPQPGAPAGCGSGTCESDNLCHEKFPIPEPLKSVAHDAGNDVVAVGARGAVYSVDPSNPANVWAKERSQSTQNFAKALAFGGRTLIATTDGVLAIRDPSATDDANRFNYSTFIAPAPVFMQDAWIDNNDVYAVGFSQEIFHTVDGVTWDLTTVAEDAQMRGINGIEGPPDEDPTGPAIGRFIAVGAGGRIVRGPAVLPAKGEVQLAVRSVAPDAGP